MKRLRPIIIFILSTLLGVEAFLFFNLDASFAIMIPSSILFGLVITLLSKPAIHQYYMLFDDLYRKHYQDKKKKLRHKSRHQSQHSHTQQVS